MTDIRKLTLSRELDRIRKAERHWSSPKIAFCIVAWLFGAIAGAYFVALSSSRGLVVCGVLMAVSSSAAIVTLLLQRWMDKRISIVLEGLLGSDERNT